MKEKELSLWFVQGILSPRLGFRWTEQPLEIINEANDGYYFNNKNTDSLRNHVKTNELNIINEGHYNEVNADDNQEIKFYCYCTEDKKENIIKEIMESFPALINSIKNNCDNARKCKNI